MFFIMIQPSSEVAIMKRFFKTVLLIAFTICFGNNINAELGIPKDIVNTNYVVQESK